MTETREKEKPLLIFGGHVGLSQAQVIRILDELGVHHRATPSSNLYHVRVSESSDLSWIDRLLERGIDISPPGKIHQVPTPKR